MSALKSLLSAMSLSLCSSASVADDAAIERGRYIVSFAGCGDCHTPGYFLGQPDLDRALSGSDVGFEIPGLGVFYGRNLTPDLETGLGAWSEDDIVTALRTGMRPDGRQLAPAMPWMGYTNLTDEDAYAVAAYLKSLPPISHSIPGPFGPGESPGGLFMRVVSE
jgi:mono/diheme cytochrome c family protein